MSKKPNNVVSLTSVKSSKSSQEQSKPESNKWSKEVKKTTDEWESVVSSSRFDWKMSVIVTVILLIVINGIFYAFD